MRSWFPDWQVLRRMWGQNLTKKIIAGVCETLSQSTNVNVWIYRASFIVLTFIYGVGILVYLVFWLIFRKSQYHTASCSCGQKPSGGGSYCKNCGRQTRKSTLNFVSKNMKTIGVLYLIVCTIFIITYCSRTNQAPVDDKKESKVVATPRSTVAEVKKPKPELRNLSSAQSGNTDVKTITSNNTTKSAPNITNKTESSANTTIPAKRNATASISSKPIRNTTIIVQSNIAGFQNTGIPLERNKRYILRSSGEIIWDIDTQQKSTPEGVNTLGMLSDVMCPGSLPMSLVTAAANNCSTVGKSIIFTPRYTTNLYLGVNDYYHDDNQGYFTVEFISLNESKDVIIDGINTKYQMKNRIRFDSNSKPIPMEYGDYFKKFSVSFWLKTNKANNEGTSGVNQNYALSHDGGQEFTSSDDSGISISVGTNGITIYERSMSAMPPVLVYATDIGSNWTHVVITEVDGVAELYVNGNFIKRGVKSAKLYVHSPKYIGAETDGHLEGEIRDVRIFNNKLSASNVYTIYQASKGDN